MPKHFQSKIGSTMMGGDTMRSGFSEFERDLEDQLSEVGLGMDELNLTANTHAS